MMRLYSTVLCNPIDPAPLKKFAKAVTNKVSDEPSINYSTFVLQQKQWLLYLSCEDEPEIVVLAAKILARLLVVHGSGYSKKFSEKNGGYTVLTHHLKRWWNVPALWPICFSILFGRDVALLDLDRPFEVSELRNLFLGDSQLQIVYPEILPVIMGMLKSGLKSTALASEPAGQASSGTDGSSTSRPNMSSCNLTGKSQLVIRTSRIDLLMILLQMLPCRTVQSTGFPF
jgi:hypothetical protein